MRLTPPPPPHVTFCDERDSLLNDIRLESDPVKIESLHVEYKLLRNKITQAKRNSKKSHYVSYFENNKMKSSDIWKGIRSLVNIKPSKTSNIKLMDANENLISDPRKIANIFNDHFATIGSNVQQKIPIEPGNFKDYLNKRDVNGTIYINPDGSSFFLSLQFLLKSQKSSIHWISPNPQVLMEYQSFY